MIKKGVYISYSRLRRLAVNTLLVVLSAAMGALLSEFAVRLAYRPGESPFHYRIPDPVLGWRLQPNVKYRYEKLDFSAQVTYNSRGWRDRERSYEKAPDTYRILVLGDSYMEAYTVDGENAFNQQLEAMGRSDGLEIEVLNLAVGGYGTLQQYLLFSEEGSDLQPDLVLLAFYFSNDLSDNSWTYESRRRNPKSLKISARPFLNEDSAGPWQISTADIEGALKRYRLSMREMTDSPWWEQTSLYGIWDQAKLVSRIQTWFKKSDNPQPADIDCRGLADYERVWLTTERILKRLSQSIEQHGFRFFVFTVAKSGGEQLVKLPLNPYGQQQAYCTDDQAVTKLKEVLDRLGVPMLNLGPIFKDEQGRSGRRVTQISDGHWNEFGHYLAAREVLSALSVHRLLPER